eukprot:14924392-Ditylum_brightwellii.AAC.1
MKHLKDKNGKSQQSYHYVSGERSQCYNKKELNTIIGKSIRAALKKEHHNCAQDEEHNAIDNFNFLSLSSSNSDDVNCT